MTAQDNVQLLRDLFAAMDTPGQESVEAMTGMLDEDIAWTAIPWNRTLHGREEVLATVTHTWEDTVPSHPITHIFADDEWVCLEYVMAGTKSGGTMLFRGGDDARGKLSVPGASIFHVKDGRVDIAREYLDLLTLHKQLGVDPQKPASSTDAA